MTSLLPQMELGTAFVASFLTHNTEKQNTTSTTHLERPVEFGQKVRPIDLALPKFGGDFLATKMLTVSGWGRFEWEGQTPDVLYEVDVPGITLSQCRDNYSRNQIKSSMICAGWPNGKRDACQGDSGGMFSYQFLLQYCTP